MANSVENLNNAEIQLKKRLIEILNEEQSFQNKKNEIMNNVAIHQIELLVKQSEIMKNMMLVCNYLRENLSYDDQ